MKRGILAGILALASPLLLAQTTTWMIDSAHSTVEFNVRHLGMSNVPGHFGHVTGSVNLNQADAKESSAAVSVEINSIDTGSESRDAVLKGSDFFDVERYPKATFTSTSVIKDGKRFKVSGNLTLHGVTKPVEMEVGDQAGADHGTHASYSASATIKREDFGIGMAFPSAIIGDEVKLSIGVQVIRQ